MITLNWAFNPNTTARNKQNIPRFVSDLTSSGFEDGYPTLTNKVLQATDSFSGYN